MEPKALSDAKAVYDQALENKEWIETLKINLDLLNNNIRNNPTHKIQAQLAAFMNLYNEQRKKYLAASEQLQKWRFQKESGFLLGQIIILDQLFEPFKELEEKILTNSPPVSFYRLK